MYLPDFWCTLLCLKCVCVCTRKGSDLISVRRAKEVIMRAEANTVFGACIRNEYMYIRACVAKINIKSK